MLLATLPALAQSQVPVQLTPLGGAVFPAERRDGVAVAVGDLDGDGHLDAVIGRYGRDSQILLGLGPGTFRPGPALPGPSWTRALALVDVDGDGDLDLVLGNDPSAGGSGQNRLLLNDGSAHFTDVTTARMPVDADATRAIAAGDVDGDGDLDLLFGNGDEAQAAGQQNRLYRNNGHGRFVDATSWLPQRLDDTAAIALADFNGDGDPDLLVANGSFATGTAALDHLDLNDGSGHFAEAGDHLPPRRDVSNAIAVADLDGDGDLDLALAAGTTSGHGVDLVLRNDGSGHFAPSDLFGGAGHSTAVAAADLDADGRADLVLGDAIARTTVLHNLGAGGFEPTPSLPDERRRTRALALADVDNDFLPDVIEVTDQGSALFLNLGFLSFYDTRRTFTLPVDVRRTRAAALADLDGNGALDVVLCGAPSNRTPVGIYLNSGNGTLGRPTSTSISLLHLEDRPLSVVVADLDGNGAPDLMLGNETTDRLYLNDGQGHLAEAPALPGGSERTRAEVGADFDGDGDLDVVQAIEVATGVAALRLYRNDGGGTFSDVSASLPMLNEETVALAAGDLDGDGDVDLVVGNDLAVSGENLVYLNDGSGAFQRARQALPPHAEPTRTLALADLDGDGDLDLLVANRRPGSQGNDTARLYLNDGTAHFTDATDRLQPSPAVNATTVAVADLDLDGNLDLVFGGDGEPLRYYLQSTGGAFDDASARLAERNLAVDVLLLGDLDGDGDPDLLAAGRDHALEINLHRQLHAPVFPRPGFPYELVMHSRPGYGGAGQTALLVFGLAAATPPLPIPGLGELRLDPSQMLILPLLPLSGSTGRASLTFDIPSLLPPLTGRTLYAQALTMPASAQSTWRLGNVTGDTVLR